MAIDENKITEAAEGFVEQLRNSYGPDAQLAMVGVVGVVLSGDGKLGSPMYFPGGSNTGTAWVLRRMADVVEREAIARGDEPFDPHAPGAFGGGG